MLVADSVVDEAPAQQPAGGLKWPSKAVLAEAALVVVAPLVLFFVLRLRPMAPAVMPDPSMHTTYILDPRDFFERYTVELQPRSGTREGARVGFLVPARLLYLAFGAVRAFFVFRYVLALVAIVPSYLLLRRLYGKAAGALAVVIVMSNPVIVTAWGTDYPDSAVASYLIAALACLVMPCHQRRRVGWLALSAAMFTLAVWSNVSAAPLVVASMVAYLVIRLVRERDRLVADVFVLLGSAVVLTGVLAVASGLLLGPFDYITPTIKAYTYLNTPSTVSHYHSRNRDWILLRPYLLAPLAAVVVWLATFARRLQSVPTPQLVIGFVCVAQIAVYSYLQFLGDAETLEQHYYSSSLWSAVCLVVAVSLGALCKPLFGHRFAAWVPAVLAVAVALLYEADPHVPAFGWAPAGLLIVLGLFVIAGVGRFVVAEAGAWGSRLAAAGLVTVIIGGSLVLTTAPYEHHAPLSRVIDDPVPAYSTALGGSAGDLIGIYRVATELPGFVGNSTYPNEILLMWYPQAQLLTLVPIIGIYHATFNSLGSSPTVLSYYDKQLLAQRRPAELLIFNTPSISTTLRLLSPYDPRLERSTVLSSGGFVLHCWLIVLGVYLQGHT